MQCFFSKYGTSDLFLLVYFLCFVFLRTSTKQKMLEAVLKALLKIEEWRKVTFLVSMTHLEEEKLESAAWASEGSR